MTSYEGGGSRYLIKSGSSLDGFDPPFSPGENAEFDCDVTAPRLSAVFPTIAGGGPW